MIRKKGETNEVMLRASMRYVRPRYAFISIVAGVVTGLLYQIWRRNRGGQ